MSDQEEIQELYKKILKAHDSEVIEIFKAMIKVREDRSKPIILS